MKGCKKKVSKGGDMMRKEWKEQKQLLKLGAGACCVSTGYVLWVPFVITDRLGGAKAPFEVRLTGVNGVMSFSSYSIKTLHVIA